MRRWWLALSLVVTGACGRLGFDATDRGAGDAGDASVDAAPGVLAVNVLRANNEANPGDPVPGAYVVFVAKDGTTEVLRTDATGTASTTVDGATTVHVAYLAMDGSAAVASDLWNVRSYAGVGGGMTLRLGATAESKSSASLTVNVPALNGATQYSTTSWLRCRLDATATMGTAVPSAFADACDGQPAPVYATATASGSLLGWLGGNATLSNGGVVDLVGPWLPARPVQLQVTELPSWVVEVAGALLDRRGTDAIMIGSSSQSAVLTSGLAMMMLETLELPAAEVVLIALGDVQFEAFQLINLGTPTAVVNDLTVTGGNMLREIASVALDPADQSISWIYGTVGRAGSAAAGFHAFTTPDGARVQWLSYVEPSVTFTLLPRLPAPLDVLVPDLTTPIDAQVGLLELQGRSYLDAVGDADRAFNAFDFAEIDPGFGISFRSMPLPTARVRPLDRVMGQPHRLSRYVVGSR